MKSIEALVSCFYTILKKRIKFVFIFYLGTILSAICFAENKVSIKYIMYQDNNQVTIKTTTLDSTIGKKGFDLSVGAVVDGISAASRDIPIVDGVTGATPSSKKKVEKRNEYYVGIGVKEKETTVKVLVDSSKEDDYASSSYFLTATQEFNNRNTALSIGYSNFDDKIFPFGVTWEDEITTKVYDLSLTQVLSPISQVRFNTTYSLSNGYLENPYHRIVVNYDLLSFYYKERHPTIRDKIAYGVFYNLSIPGEMKSSLQLNYRYYFDNWEITSNTYELKYNRYFTDKLWISAVGRNYNQRQAFFFKNFYTEEERFMTADLKLASFITNLYGLGINYALTSWIDLELTYQIYNKKTNLDYSPYVGSVAKEDLKSNLFFSCTSIKF